MAVAQKVFIARKYDKYEKRSKLNDFSARSSGSVIGQGVCTAALNAAPLQKAPRNLPHRRPSVRVPQTYGGSARRQSRQPCVAQHGGLLERMPDITQRGKDDDFVIGQN